jgi:hypothetical protein
MLTLFEELFLLALHEEKGTPLASAKKRLRLAFSGATLCELALMGKLRIEQDHRVEIVDPAGTGDRLLDKAQQIILSSKHPRKIIYWTKTLIEPRKKQAARIAKRLVGKNVIREVDLHWTLVIPDNEHPERPASHKYWLKSRLRDQVFACAEVSLHDLALLSMLGASGLLSLVFTRDEEKTALRRVHEIVVDKALTVPAASTVEEIAEAVATLASAD